MAASSPAGSVAPIASSRPQIAVAAAVETCWLTIAENSVANPSARRRSGSGPVSSSAAREARLDRREVRRALGDVVLGLDDAPDHASP